MAKNMCFYGDYDAQNMRPQTSRDLDEPFSVNFRVLIGKLQQIEIHIKIPERIHEYQKR